MLPKGTTTQKSLEAIDQIASFYRQASQPKVIVDELEKAGLTKREIGLLSADQASAIRKYLEGGDDETAQTGKELLSAIQSVGGRNNSEPQIAANSFEEVRRVIQGGGTNLEGDGSFDLEAALAGLGLGGSENKFDKAEFEKFRQRELDEQSQVLKELNQVLNIDLSTIADAFAAGNAQLENFATQLEEGYQLDVNNLQTNYVQSLNNLTDDYVSGKLTRDLNFQQGKRQLLDQLGEAESGLRDQLAAQSAQEEGSLRQAGLQDSSAAEASSAILGQQIDRGLGGAHRGYEQVGRESQERYDLASGQAESALERGRENLQVNYAQSLAERNLQYGQSQFNLGEQERQLGVSDRNQRREALARRNQAIAASFDELGNRLATNAQRAEYTSSQAHAFADPYYDQADAYTQNYLKYSRQEVFQPNQYRPTLQRTDVRSGNLKSQSDGRTNVGVGQRLGGY